MDAQTIFNALIGLAVIAIPAYYSWQSKKADTETAISSNEDEVIRANTELQVELANAAKAMIAPLKETVLRLENKLKLQDAELNQVRQAAKEQTVLIENIRRDYEKRITEIVDEYTEKLKQLEEKYEKRLEELNQEAIRARKSEQELLVKIRKIKEGLDVDTGRLNKLERGE